MAKDSNDAGLYYKAIARLRTSEVPKDFNVCDMFPDINEHEVAEHTADYFTKIAERFNPLTNEEIPNQIRRDEPIKITTEEIAKRPVRGCPAHLLGPTYPSSLHPSTPPA